MNLGNHALFGDKGFLLGVSELAQSVAPYPIRDLSINIFTQLKKDTLYILLILGSVRVWRGGEGKSEEPVLVTGWHLAPELVPQVKS